MKTESGAAVGGEGEALQARLRPRIARAGRLAVPLSCLLMSASAAILAGPARAQERLSLSESVSTALRDNPELEAARHQRNAALADANRARPVLMPDVQLTAGHVRRGPVVRFDDFEGTGREILPKSRSKVELTIQQTLYQFGVGNAPGKRVSGMSTAARADYHKAELDLVQQVQEAYYNALEAQALQRVANE